MSDQQSAATTSATSTSTGTPAPTQAASTSTGTGTQSSSTPGTTGGADWTHGMNDELRGYVQNKGFKDPVAVLDSYRAYEKLQGVPQDRLLKLPENMDSPEGRAVLERIGAPKEAAAYTIAIPKENGDPKLADGLRDVAFKQGFTQRQVEGLVGWWNSMQESGRAAQMDATQTKMTNALNNLKKEWGNAFDERKLKADQGAVALGMGEAEVNALGAALGPDKAMILLHKIATATGESQFLTGNQPSNGALTPEQAKAQIRDLEQDKGFIKRLMAKDKDAMRQWNKAHEYAFPGQQAL